MSEQELKRKNLKLLREKITLKNNILEYKKCKNNTHLLVGLTIVRGVLPIPGLLKIIEVISTKTLIASISIIGLISIYGTIKTNNHFKRRLNQLKINNPKIDFDAFTDKNIENLNKEIQSLNNLALQECHIKKPQETKPKVYQNIPPIHTKEPDTKGYVKSIGTLKRRG